MEESVRVFRPNPTRWRARHVTIALVWAAICAIAIYSFITAEPRLLAADARVVQPIEPQAVLVVTANRRELPQTISVIGSMVPRESVLVGAQIGGYAVTDVAADEGDYVMSGQLLAKLSSDTIQAQLSQNDATLTRTEAMIAQARAQIDQMRGGEIQAVAALDRAEKLLKVGSATQDVLDQRIAAARSIKAQAASAEQGLALAKAEQALAIAQRRELKLNLSRTDIRSPANGIVLSRSVQLGAVVSGGGTLFHIAKDGVIELAASVPDSAISQIAPGQKVLVHSQGSGSPILGTVRMISPEVDNTTRLGRLRIALPAGVAARSGSFARAEIEIGRRTSIVLPPSAIQSSANEASVKIVAKGTVETRAVGLGIRRGGAVEILSGLTPGESVALRAGPFLRDGETVTPILAADRDE